MQVPEATYLAPARRDFGFRVLVSGFQVDIGVCRVYKVHIGILRFQDFRVGGLGFGFRVFQVDIGVCRAEKGLR